MKVTSLRFRLILAYAGLIVLGFGGLALMAGRQLSNTARQDYERQTANEVILVAEGMEQYLVSYYNEDIDEDELYSILSIYEERTDANLNLVLLTEDEYQSSHPQGRPPTNPNTNPNYNPNSSPTPYQNNEADSDDYEEYSLPPFSRDYSFAEQLRAYPELQSAIRGNITIDKRKNENGDMTVYTAAAINSRFGFLGFVQLSEPISRLNQQIYERWALLGIGVLIITIVSLIASIWLSVSLVRPLQKLRESALQLSQGNLSYRAPSSGTEELNEVAHAFNEMADQLQAMIEEQRAFAGNTSHELRTPLTTMRLRTEALRHDADLDEATRQEYIRELDDELLRMTGLIEDLILLSRFDAGRAPVGDETIDFLRFADSMSLTMQRKATEKNIDLQLHRPDAGTRPVLVSGSLNHLSILFRNILENAIKYTPSGGTITWNISCDGDAILNRIQDSGQGIEPENLPHIFDRFYRGDKARSRTIQGTGLGLSLVKAIADVYKVPIKVESAGIGQGTSVLVRWHRATPSSQNHSSS